MAINDVTYLLDESLQLLRKIHDIETEMDNKTEWDALPMVKNKTKKFKSNRKVFLLGKSNDENATIKSIRISMLYLFTIRNGNIEHVRIFKWQRIGSILFNGKTFSID